MTRLKDFIENCRWALPTAGPISCKEQSQAALPHRCVLLQGLLSASHPETKPFSFYYYWRLWLFSNFLSFVAGMSSICFSVIDSCSYFSPPAFGWALCSAELCQCLQLLELCLCSSCLCPAASSILATACASSAPWDTLCCAPRQLCWDSFIPFCTVLPCSCAGGKQHLERTGEPASVSDTGGVSQFAASSPAAGNSRLPPGWSSASLTKEVLTGSCKLGYLPRSWAYLHFSVASTVALLILMNSSCASRSYCWSGSLKEQDGLAQDITNDWHQSHTLTGSCSILLRGLLLSCC